MLNLKVVNFCPVLYDFYDKTSMLALTSLSICSESQMRAYEECVSDAIIQHNQLAEDSDR